MNIKRILKMFIYNPNSSEGLIMRAEILEEESYKTIDVNYKEKLIVYARILRELSSKKLGIEKNKEFIKKHLRGW